MDKHAVRIITLTGMGANYLNLFEELWQEYVEFTPEQMANYISAAEYLKGSGLQRDWKKLEEIKEALANDMEIQGLI